MRLGARGGGGGGGGGVGGVFWAGKFWEVFFGVA